MQFLTTTSPLSTRALCPLSCAHWWPTLKLLAAATGRKYLPAKTAARYEPQPLSLLLLSPPTQYNNQWMIIDYSLFTPHAQLPDGTLWIIEQLPGKTRAADVTDFLRRDGRCACCAREFLVFRKLSPFAAAGSATTCRSSTTYRVTAG